MQAITIYYLVFAVIELAMVYGLYRSWRGHLAAWKAQQNALHISLMLLAVLLLIAATAIMAFMLFLTFDSWRISLDPTVPKPMFEIFFIFGVLAAGIGAGFANGLHALVRRDYDYFLK